MSQVVELTAEECVSLLRTTSVGRIGVVTPGGPVIFPVNYVVVGEAVVFRTLPYGVIANHAHDADVAFEVDRLDEAMREGWSVLATGRSHRIEDPGEVRVIREELELEPWADGHRNLYFRVAWTNLSGRQLGSGARPDLVPTAGTAT